MFEVPVSLPSGKAKQAAGQENPGLGGHQGERDVGAPSPPTGTEQEKTKEAGGLGRYGAQSQEPWEEDIAGRKVLPAPRAPAPER